MEESSKVRCLAGSQVDIYRIVQCSCNSSGTGVFLYHISYIIYSALCSAVVIVRVRGIFLIIFRVITKSLINLT